jgi:hypothetical protein
MPRVLPVTFLAALVALLPAGTLAKPRAAGTTPAGTLVFVAGANRLTAIDVATGRRTVRNVAGVASCGPNLHVTGGHVVLAGVRRAHTVILSVPLTLGRAPIRLGGAHAYVPSATPGRVWLAGLNCNRPRMVGAREMTVGGRVTATSARRLPAGWLAGAARDGLVLQRGRTLLVWDPLTGRTLRRLPLQWVTDSRAGVLAGCATGSRCREPAIVSAATARAVVAHAPGRYRLELGGVLSPDGKLLAAPAVRHRRWRVALVRTADGATSFLRGPRLGRTCPRMAWAESSGRLFIAGRGGHVAAYRPGAARAVAVPARLPASATSFAAG